MCVAWHLKPNVQNERASQRQSNVLDICRCQIIETCDHKNHFFLQLVLLQRHFCVQRLCACISFSKDIVTVSGCLLASLSVRTNFLLIAFFVCVFFLLPLTLTLTSYSVKQSSPPTKISFALQFEFLLSPKYTIHTVCVRELIPPPPCMRVYCVV